MKRLLLLLVIASFPAIFFAKSIYSNEQVQQARTVANMVEMIGKWAAQYKGIWIKEAKGEVVDLNSHLDTLAVNLVNQDNSLTDQESVQETLNFHLKNPALVQREISDLMKNDNAKTSFRITSDKYMNPKNSPNSFERKAIETMRENKSSEYFEERNGKMLYARALVATEACMRCHESAQKAPAAVQALYPTHGYGYQLGQVEGIISVQIPDAFGPKTLLAAFDWLSAAIAAIALVLAAMVLRKN